MLGVFELLVCVLEMFQSLHITMLNLIPLAVMMDVTVTMVLILIV